MTAAEQILADRLTVRIAMCHDRFEQTGDLVWLDAATKTDAAYQRLMARGA